MHVMITLFLTNLFQLVYFMSPTEVTGVKPSAATSKTAKRPTIGNLMQIISEHFIFNQSICSDWTVENEKFSYL